MCSFHRPAHHLHAHHTPLPVFWISQELAWLTARTMTASSPVWALFTAHWPEVLGWIEPLVACNKLGFMHISHFYSLLFILRSILITRLVIDKPRHSHSVCIPLLIYMILHILHIWPNTAICIAFTLPLLSSETQLQSSQRLTQYAVRINQAHRRNITVHLCFTMS